MHEAFESTASTVRIEKLLGGTEGKEKFAERLPRNLL